MFTVKSEAYPGLPKTSMTDCFVMTVTTKSCQLLLQNVPS